MRLRNRDQILLENIFSDMQNGRMKRYILIDLYTGKSEPLPAEEFQEAIQGLQKVPGAITVYKGEEYLIVVV